MKRIAARVLVSSVLLLTGTASPRTAHADGVADDSSPPGALTKDLGVHSPRGRRIYRGEAELATVVDSRRRVFVIEAAIGAGPEGNLGLVVGWMPKRIHGLELYAGAGLEWNPAYHLSASARYLFNIHGYRPYVALGYFYKDAYVIDTFAHNAFLEAGYSWKLGATSHLTIGAGVARLLHVGVRADSVLRTSEVDSRSLEAQVDSVPAYLPMLAARFSRAF